MRRSISKFLALIVFSEFLHGATVYHVNSNGDTGAGAGNMGDLRYVINQLNLPASDLGSTIVFDLPFGMETITLTSPLPPLNLLSFMPMTFPNLISIDGQSTLGPIVTIDGSNLYPGFELQSIDTSFTIQNLIVQNCSAIGANGAMPGTPGGSAVGGTLNCFTFPLNPLILQNVQFLNSKAIGGNGNQADGGPAQGGAIYTFLPLTINGSATIDGIAQAGIPTPAAPTTFGSTVFGFTTMDLNPALVTDTILFNNSFVIIGDMTQNGLGTVTLQTTDTSPPNGDFPPSVYYGMGNVSINSGTFNLNGTVTQLSSGALLPLPVFGAGMQDLVFAGPSTLSGTGLVFATTGKQTIFQGASIRPSPGILFLLGDIDFQAGTNIYTQVAPTQTAAISLSGFDFPSAPFDISNVTLNVDVQAGSYSTPTVYALVLSAGLFQGQFQNIIVNNASTLVNPTPVYSPLSAPNSLLLPVNVPYGISNVNIVLGTITLTSTVLYDPCAGIVVVNLLAPGLGAAALSAFFANQSVLTSQTLSSITTALNAQCLKSKGGGSANPQGPLANWNEHKKLLVAQNSFDSNPMPPDRPKEEQVEEKRAFLPSLLPTPREAPKYSVSVTPLAQFQHQHSVETWNAFVPTYDTKTWGAILGFDYIGWESVLVGGAATVAWTDLHVDKNGGTQHIWSVFGTAYSSFTFGHFFCNLLATGSYNYNRAVRNFAPIAGETLTIESASPFGIKSVYSFQSTGIPGGTAHSKFNSYQLVPHFDANYEIGFGWLSLVPFLLADCSISFSDSIAETGENFLNVNACLNKISLNIATDNLINFIIQSEAGANLFEQIELAKDELLIFRQKASYVNRYYVPYTLRSKLIDSIEYTNTHLTLPMQHMFGCSAEMIYRWDTFSAVITYEGIVGSGFLSNAAYLRFSRDY